MGLNLFVCIMYHSNLSSAQVTCLTGRLTFATLTQTCIENNVEIV